jgi:ferrous iron transport protein B
VRRYLRDNNPDVVVNVVDGSNLERNLYLTTELIDMDYPMVIALNMFDEMRNAGTVLNYDALGSMIGVPVVPTVSRTGEGVSALFDTIISVFERRNEVVRHVHVKLSADLEAALTEIKDAIKADKSVNPHYSPRYLAIKLLEGDSEANEVLNDVATGAEIRAIRDRKLQDLSRQHPDEDIAAMIAGEKYGFIAGALAETLTKTESEKVDTTHLIDAIVTNRLFGFPIFLLIMLFIFWITFVIGSYPQDWIQMAVDWLGGFLSANMAAGPLKDLLINGVIGGVGGVIVFLPNILILFFCISFMEDSGYMARAAFIMDRIMHKIGLHGKSFIPMVMGFGCNVPAVMAARAIESRSSRAITVMITPFMSCSARLPIYVLLIGTFFSANAALVFLGMYALGVAVAAITARMLRKLFFKRDETPFVMELPPYRVPTMKTSVRHMWSKGKEYLNKMGGIILFAAIVVWALNYFPLHDDNATPSATTSTPVSASAADMTVSDSNEIDPEHDSYLEMMGKAVNPVLAPLGFSWRATVAAIAGVPAKEIVVSTLGVLYTGDDESTDTAISARISTPDSLTGKPDFDRANALSFMVFILLYCPCIATIVAIVKETHSVWYGVFAVLYNTTVAWLLSFATYHLALLF